MMIQCFGLNEPEVQEGEPRKIEKVFDYEEDIEEIGKKLDKQNREKFSKEECDSIFLTSTDILDDINTIKIEKTGDFTEHIEEIKKQALKEEILFSSEEFDIFGGITEDKTKIRSLGNSKHREIEKSKYRLLEINKNTENEQYIKTLEEVNKYLDGAIEKAKFGMKLNGFFASTGALNNQKYNILYIEPENALDTLKDCEKINLYNINLNENTKAIALTNIMYYDNSNKTLPIRNEYRIQNISRHEQIEIRTKETKII